MFVSNQLILPFIILVDLQIISALLEGFFLITVVIIIVTVVVAEGILTHASRKRKIFPL